MFIQIAGRARGSVSNYGGLRANIILLANTVAIEKSAVSLILNDSVVEIRRSTKLHEITHEMFSDIARVLKLKILIKIAQPYE